MAKRITSEDLVLNLILDADGVNKGNNKLLGELHKLDRETRELQIQLNKYKLELRNLDKNSKGYAERVKFLNKQIKSLGKQINANHAQMNEWRRQIGLSGLTINQLNSHLAALKVQLNNATDPGTLRRLRHQIRLTEERMERMRTGMTRMAQAWRRMGTFANQFGTLSAWMTIAVFGLSRAISSTTKNMRKLDEQYSSVMKTTDLARGEVAKLKKEFDQLNESEDTRTPTRTKQLLEISRIAGRLGIRGVENIRDFTLAVDKLYVALGDDLDGSVEEITEQVGKLVNVFGVAKEGGLEQSEALLRVGSVLNELGKSSEASAQNILNFTSRMGGVGSMAHFTIDQLAGIGATLDATGVKAERGSTAVIKLITGLGEYAEKFSRILGISMEEYTRRIDEDVNAVFLDLMELSSKGNTSILEVVQSMGDMNVRGVRVAETFGKLSQNIEMVREQQEIAARAFESSASVMNEYYIITKDWDSLMALQGKRLKSLADDYSKSMTPAMYKLYRGFIDFLFALKDVAVWIGENTGLIWGLTAAITAFKSHRIGLALTNAFYATVRWAESLGFATRNIWAHNIAVRSMRIAYIQAGGGINGVRKALIMLGGVMIKHPATAFVAVITTAAAAFFLFRKRVNQVDAAIDSINAKITTQTAAMNYLFEAIKDTNTESSVRSDLIKEANTIYGQYLDNLLSEKDTEEQIEAARKKANDELATEIALKGQREKLDKLQEKYEKKINKEAGSVFGNKRLMESEPGLAATAKGEFKILQDSLVKQYKENEKWTEEMLNQADEFITKYKKLFREPLDYVNAPIPLDYANAPMPLGMEVREDIQKVVETNKEYEDELEKIFTFVKQYRKTIKQFKDDDDDGGEYTGTLLSDDAFKAAKEEAELLRDEQLLALKKMGLDKEEYRERELKLEEEYLRKVLKLTEKNNTTLRKAKEEDITLGSEIIYKEGEAYVAQLIGGNRDILDAQMELQDNLNAQMDDGGKERIDKEKQTMDEMEVLLLEMLEKREITQNQFDALMLQMQEDYYARMIAKERREGGNVLEWEKKWYENRLKQREEYEKQQNLLREAMRYAFELPEEETDPREDALVEQMLHRRKRVRQFMSLEYGQNEGLENEFAVFETENFAGQLEQLREWYNQGILSHDEYERRKTDITREQTNMRLKQNAEVLSAINGLLGAQGQLFAAQKDAELEKAGDNKKKQLAIQEKYAKKEQAIAVGQAIISGALSVMRIWEAKSMGDPITDSIIKGILTAAMVATTGVQIATIRAQQFAKGSYPVVGADDGRTYQAEYVGRPKTGVYKKPSLGLFAENPEMVIDYPTLKNIQMNSPALIDAIMAHRTPSAYGISPKGGESPAHKMPQYAEGNYPAGAGVSNSDMAALIRENTRAMQELKNLKVYAAIETIERERENYIRIQGESGL